LVTVVLALNRFGSKPKKLTRVNSNPVDEVLAHDGRTDILAIAHTRHLHCKLCRRSAKTETMILFPHKYVRLVSCREVPLTDA